MPGPFAAGPNLEIAQWQELRTRAIFDYCKWDHQSEDNSVLARFPLFVEPETVSNLGNLAEGLCEEALAAEEEILKRPELFGRLAIPREIARLLQENTEENPASEDVRVMRFDFHFTTAGWKISEVNADVPGGFVEASGWNYLFSREFAGTKAAQDPTKEYVLAIQERIRPGGLIGLVHATVYSDDRQTMLHFSNEMKRVGLKPCLLGASHFTWKDGRAHLQCDFAEGAPDFLMRFLPAEWLPKVARDEQWKPWFSKSETPQSNPGRSILLQTKRFPLVWSELDTKLATWRELLPETRCPSEMNEVVADEWVLKPCFGRVGDGVGMRGVTNDQEYEEIQNAAKRNSGNWVAQRRFETVSVETEDGPVFPCVGVYTINRKMAGLYARVGRTPLINETAQDAAILIWEGK